MRHKELESRIAEITDIVYKIMSRSVEEGKTPDVINKATSLMVEIYELNKIIEHNLPIGSDKQKVLQNKIYKKLKATLKKANELLTSESIDDVKYMIHSYMRLI